MADPEAVGKSPEQRLVEAGDAMAEELRKFMVFGDHSTLSLTAMIDEWRAAATVMAARFARASRPIMRGGSGGGKSGVATDTGSVPGRPGEPGR